MALVKSSDRSNADYLDLKVLAGEAVVMTVREIEDETDLGNGPLCPVRARVIILTGQRAGETHENERILPAGVRSKLTEVGDDVVGRLAIYGTRKAIGLNNEADGDIELAEAALADADAAKTAPKTAKPAAAQKTEPAAKAAPKSNGIEVETSGDDDGDEDPDF